MKKIKEKGCCASSFIPILFPVLLMLILSGLSGCSDKNINDDDEGTSQKGTVQKSLPSEGGDRGGDSPKDTDEDSVSDLKLASEDCSNDKVNYVKKQLTDQLILGKNSSRSLITTNLNLPEKLPKIGGVQVEWQSSNMKIIDNKGVVTRSRYTAAEPESIPITLVANIRCGNISELSTFELTVKSIPRDDEMAVNDDFSLIDIGYIGLNDSATGVRGLSVTLLKEGPSGTTITWRSTDDKLINSNGDVFRPRASLVDNDPTVLLIATIKRGAVERIKEFTLTVIRAPKDNKEIVKEVDGGVQFFLPADKLALKVTQVNNENIIDATTGNFCVKNNILVNMGANSAGLNETLKLRLVPRFANNNMEYFNAENGCFSIPEAKSGDPAKTVTFNFSVIDEKNNELGVTKGFSVTIQPKKEIDDQAILSAAKETLEKLVFGNTDPIKKIVDQKLDLKTAIPGFDGTVTWSIKPAGIIDPSGAVHHPSFQEGDAKVELIASLLVNGKTDTKQFDVLVVAIPPDDRAAIDAAKEKMKEVDTLKMILNGNPGVDKITKDLKLPDNFPFGVRVK
ncbi:MAG: hypothetical protein HQK53_14605, partial [Oligoflexia bacterium]|nr:hypothetical protein [Oligoflexia bacterium]